MEQGRCLVLKYSHAVAVSVTVFGVAERQLQAWLYLVEPVVCLFLATRGPFYRVANRSVRQFIDFHLPCVKVVQFIEGLMFISVVNRIAARISLPIFSGLFFPVSASFRANVRRFTSVTPEHATPVAR